MSNNADRLIAKANESDAKRRAQSEKTRTLIAKAEASDAKRAAAAPQRMQTSGVKAPGVITQMWAAEPLTQKIATSQVWDAVPQVKQEETKQKKPALQVAMQSGTADYLTDAMVESDAQFADYANSGMRLWQADLAKKRNELSASGLAGTEELKWLDDEVEKLTPQERRVFYYIYGVDGASAARAYAEDPKKQQKWYKDAREGRARLAGYEELRGADDFAEKSQYKTTYQPGTEHFNPISGTYDNTGYGDLYYDYINKDEKAVAQYESQASKNNLVALGLDMGERKELYDEEIALYNYLYALDEEAGDKNHTRANDYIKLLTSELNAREREKAREYWERKGKEHPVISSAFSVATAPMKVFGYMGQTMDYLSGVPIDPNEGYNRHSHINKDIRETVSETITNSGAWGPVGSFLYNTGMSMADFLYTNAITGGGSVGSKLALSIMGTSTAADTVIDAKERGLSDDQAFTLGTIAGAAEIITERFSIDALFKGDWEKSALKYILRNGLTEGSEEVAADLINNIADILISKSQSEWKKAIDAYVANGKRKDEAFILALTDQAKQMGLSFVGGFISGGVSSSGRAVVGKVGNLISQKANVTKKEQGAATLPISPEEQVREAVERRNAEIRNTQVQAQQPGAQGAQAQGQTVQPVSPQEMVQRAMQARTARNETKRTGILAGAKESDIRAGEILSDVFGRRVVFFDKAPTADGIENGFYDAATGTIHVNVRSENVFAQIFSHELTHSIEKSRAYQNFSRAVLQQIGKTSDIVAMRKEIARIYDRNGQALKSEAAIDRELVAKYVEEHLLTDEESIMRLAQQNRTITQRIKHWIDAAIAALGNADAKERAFLYRAQALYAKALKQTKMQAQGITAKERLGYLRADFNAGILTQEEFDNELEEIMAEDDWETVSEEGEENAVEKSQEKDYNDDKMYSYKRWHSDLTKKQMLELVDRVRADVKTSKNAVTDTSNWLFTEIDGMPVFAIYSTNDVEDPTILYESKGEKGKYEKELVEALGKEKEYGVIRTAEGIKGFIENLGSKQGGNYLYRRDTLRTEDANGNVGVVSGSFKFEPTRALRNCLENLLKNRGAETQEVENRKYSFSPIQYSSDEKTAHAQAALKHFGKTYKWTKTGYLTQDGDRIDFSGEHGYRTLDHREIRKALGDDYGGDDYSGAMVQFMAEGNIRITTENDGINLSVKPTKEQFEKLESFILRAHGEVILDIDDTGGNTVVSVEYPRGTRPSKIFSDINNWFDNGEKPYVSEVSQFHYSFSPAQKKTADAAYMRAVEDGDVETAQRMVDEAAERTGFKEKVYHGTLQFGFTEIDVSKSDDAISFFATDSKEVAYTYTENHEVRKIGKKQRKDIETLVYEYNNEVDKFVEMVNKGADEYGFRKVNENFLKEIAENIEKDGFFFESVSEDLHAYMGTIVGDITYSLKHHEQTKASKEILEKVYSAFKSFESALKEISMGARGEGWGVYEFFAKTDGMLQIDAKGADWDKIKIGGREVSTRTIAKAAKTAGYKGVKIANVYDQGGIGAQLGVRQSDAATVYIFFDPKKQVKSADPVTYDDDGNVIPLSERFNTQNNDIRYSFSPAQQKTAEEQQSKVEWLHENLEKGEIPTAHSQLDSKATAVLNSAEAKLTRTLTQAFGIHGNETRQTLRQYAADIAEEYLYFGMVSEYTMQQMFNEVWNTATHDNAEYIAQYEEVKAYLSKNGVSVSEDIKNEIPDYNEWRKAQMGKLKISKDALPVDVLYQTLSDIAPEQFPPDVNAPTDQLMLMSEMANKLVKREEFLHDLSGRDADEIKRITEMDFRACIEDFENEIFKVKKYRDAQSKETVKRRKQEEELAPKTTDEVLSMYDEMKKARKVYERVAAKQLLTPHEQMTVGQLLRGQASLEDLDPNDPRSAAIEAVYEARAEFEKYAESVRAYNSIRRQKLYSQADKYLQNMNSWEDKGAGWKYARETMERNMVDITKNVPDDGEAINKAYFAKVHKNEANATHGKNEYRNRVTAMNLSRKAKDGEVSEAAAVQIIGEAQDAMRKINNSNGRVKYVDGKTYEDWKALIDAVWESSPSLDQAKVQTAVNEFRKIYDELFAMMNDARVKNGYEPVDYRLGYFPHFKADTLNTFAKALGIQTDVTELPTTIAGLTHTFKPGIRFIPNALQRKGVNTTYDAVEGFDRYIEGVMDVIHHTEDIQRLRALASRIRYWASDKGIQEKHDEINKRDDLNDDQKKALIDDLYKNAPYRLSNFVQTLDEYTNLLANKKSAHDRQTESDIGRRMYNVVKALEGRIAANMVAVNPGSWLTNFIPLTQAWGVVDSKYMLGGMWQTLKAYKNSDGITDRSDFLTNRRGSDAIAKTTMQKVSSAASAGMEIIDNFVADSIVRARYEQNKARGLSENAALEEADALAASVMADRSKGALPTIFGRKNPATKLLTQFQVEVNNQLSFLFKDLPREKREEGIGKLVWALLKYAIGAYIYNNIYEAIVGRRPALDPIGILNDTVGDFTGYELPSLIDVVGSIDDIARGDETLGDQFKTEKKNAAKAMAGIGENVLQEVPFVGGLLGGGRLPISSALPSIKNLGNAIDWTNEQSGKKRAVTIATEIAKPLLYLAPPFGGGQAKKLAEGVATIIQGGSYKRDNKGEQTLQYPVKRNVGEIAQTALFGKSATSGARTWVESGFASLTAGQTKAYQKMVDLGEDEYKVYDFMRKLSKTEKSEQYSKQVEQVRAISKSKFSEKAKQEAVRSLFGTSESGVKARKKFDKLVKAGLEVEDYLRLKEEDCVDRFEKYAVSGNVSRDAAVQIARDLEEAENANGDEKDLSNNDRYRIIFDGNYSTKDTEEALRATMDEKTQNKVNAMDEYGVDCTLWADYKLTYSVMYPNDKESGERVEDVLRKMDLTKDQRAAIYQAVTRNKEENNPFGSKVAKSVEDAIKQAEE